MRQALGVLAVVMISILAGCATTGDGASASSGGAKPMILSSKDAPLACTGGWHACVCSKEEKCCSFRTDCECGTSGENAGKALCK